MEPTPRRNYQKQNKQIEKFYWHDQTKQILTKFKPKPQPQIVQPVSQPANEPIIIEDDKDEERVRVHNEKEPEQPPEEASKKEPVIEREPEQPPEELSIEVNRTRKILKRRKRVRPTKDPKKLDALKRLQRKIDNKRYKEATEVVEYFFGNMWDYIETKEQKERRERMERIEEELNIYFNSE